MKIYIVLLFIFVCSCSDTDKIKESLTIKGIIEDFNKNSTDKMIEKILTKKYDFKKDSSINDRRKSYQSYSLGSFMTIAVKRLYVQFSNNKLVLLYLQIISLETGLEEVYKKINNTILTEYGKPTIESKYSSKWHILKKNKSIELNLSIAPHNKQTILLSVTYLK